MPKKQHDLRRLGLLSVVAAAAATVAGCGGGGGGGGSFPISTGSTTTSTTTSTQAATIPSSALTSSDAFISYLKTVVANKSDTDDALRLGDSVAPVDDMAPAASL